MRFPFSIITKPLGGIAINRGPKKENEERLSHTEAMINLFRDNKELIIVITPEGTRSKRTAWKTGFYHIARGAGVPICLSDFDRDMRTIMDFYKQVHPKFPEKFSIDTNYA